MPVGRTASITGRCENKKRKFVSSCFCQTECELHSGCTATLRDDDKLKRCRRLKCAPIPRGFTVRRVRSRTRSAATPAYCSASRRPRSSEMRTTCRFSGDAPPAGYPGFPARTWVARIARPSSSRYSPKQSANPEGRQHLHFDFGCDERLLRQNLGVDLDDAADAQKIAAGVSGINLPDAKFDGVLINRPNKRFRSLLAAATSAVLRLICASRQVSDAENLAKRTLSLSSRSHLRSRERIHLAYSPNAALVSSSF